MIAQVVIEDPKEALDNVLLMKYTLGWTCVGVFIVTAIAACIALFRPKVIPDERIRKRLYQFVILEIAGISVAVFGGLLDPKNLEKPALEAIERANQDAKDVAEAAADLNVSPSDDDFRPFPPRDATPFEAL